MLDRLMDCEASRDYVTFMLAQPALTYGERTDLVLQQGELNFEIHRLRVELGKFLFFNRYSYLSVMHPHTTAAIARLNEEIDAMQGYLDSLDYPLSPEIVAEYLDAILQIEYARDGLHDVQVFRLTTRRGGNLKRLIEIIEGEFG